MAKEKAVYKAPRSKGSTLRYFKRYWQLYALVALPIIYLLVFKYLPMKNIIIAFKEYKLNMPLHEMPWASNHGMKYFIKAFGNADFIRSLRNTVLLNLSLSL